MFSALKKLVGSEPGQLRDKNIPAGLQSMNQSLQRRFAKGVQYNSKLCSQSSEQASEVKYVFIEDCSLVQLISDELHVQSLSLLSENSHPGR